MRVIGVEWENKKINYDQNIVYYKFRKNYYNYEHEIDEVGDGPCWSLSVGGRLLLQVGDHHVRRADGLRTAHWHVAGRHRTG